MTVDKYCAEYFNTKKAEQLCSAFLVFKLTTLLGAV